MENQLKKLKAAQQKLQKKAHRRTGLGPVRTIPRGSALATASRAAVVATVRAQEKGYVDTAVVGYAMDTTGGVTLVATIAQGASVNQRIGKKCMIRSVQIRGVVQNNSAALGNKGTAILVYDRRPTGALPLVTDILVSISSSAFPNDNNTGRFKTLWRRDYDLMGAPSITAGTDHSQYTVEDFVKVNKKMIFKAAGTGAIADIEEGAIYLVQCGANAAGTTACTFTVGFRTRFTEF